MALQASASTQACSASNSSGAHSPHMHPHTTSAITITLDQLTSGSCVTPWRSAATFRGSCARCARQSACISCLPSGSVPMGPSCSTTPLKHMSVDADGACHGLEAEQRLEPACPVISPLVWILRRAFGRLCRAREHSGLIVLVRSMVGSGAEFRRAFSLVLSIADWVCRNEAAWGLLSSSEVRRHGQPEGC